MVDTYISPLFGVDRVLLTVIIKMKKVWKLWRKLCTRMCNVHCNVHVRTTYTWRWLGGKGRGRGEINEKGRKTKMALHCSTVHGTALQYLAVHWAAVTALEISDLSREPCTSLWNRINWQCRPPHRWITYGGRAFAVAGRRSSLNKNKIKIIFV